MNRFRRIQKLSIFKIPSAKPLSSNKITEKNKIYPVNDLPNRHGIALSSVPAGGHLTCVYRPVYYYWDSDESSYVTQYGDYKTQLEVVSRYPLFRDLYATSEFRNDGYGTYYDYKRMLQFKSIIYQMCNSTPYPFTVDFYFRAWLPYYSCPVQIVDSPPNSEYAYLVNPGLPYEMGKYKKWPDMSVTLQPHTTINKEVPFSFLLEAPTTTDKDRINRAYIPQSDGNMACVVTPDFS